MGKKARTAIMSFDLINEIITMIAAALSVAAIQKISAELPMVYGIRAGISVITGALGLFFAVMGLRCVIKDEKNTLLFAALWFSLVVNTVRTIMFGFNIVILFRTFHISGANLLTTGSVSSALLLTSGRGALCFLTAAFMAVMLFELSGKED
ncbi:MAG: hypothetical protein IKS17_06200 [Firmicutes bacterium]|nr:hypothetical protein [Bacillota bacterium]